MTTATAPLISLVRGWERRRRWGVVLVWLPRTLIPGLMIGVLLAVYARLRPGLPDSLTYALAAGLCAVGALALMVSVWLRQRPPVLIARHFDLELGLRERISTALELLDGRISGDPGLTALQVADAHEVAQNIRPEEALPLRTDLRGWIAVGILLLALLVLAFIPPATTTPDEAAQERAAVDAITEAVEDIAADIASDPNLTDEQRQPLLEALQTQLEALQDPDISLEEAFASLSEIQSQLNDAAEDIQQQLEQQADAADAANQALQQGRDPNEPGEAPPATLGESIEQVQQDLETMTDEQAQATADALDAAADTLAETDPQTAQALQEAAEALREGDLQAALEALERAQDSQQQQAQEQGERQEGQLEQLQNSAQAAEQARQQAAQESESEQPSPSEGQPQEGEGEQGGEGGESEGSGGSETGEQPSEGDTPGLGSGSDSAVSEGSGSETTEGAQGLGGEGAGDGAGILNQDSSERLQPRNPNLEQPDNNPDGRGVGEYEPIFAPRFAVEASGDDEVELRADPGDVPLDEGEFQENAFGQSVVPYNAVFSDYADAATRALESGYVPLGLRDVVRQYFSSLDPAAGE